MTIEAPPAVRREALLWTVPNVLTFIRIALIPALVILLMMKVTA